MGEWLLHGSLCVLPVLDNRGGNEPMNIYMMSNEGNELKWVIAEDWTDAYNQIARDYPEFDVVSARNYTRGDDIIITEKVYPR